jgi:hypothetical protein
MDGRLVHTPEIEGAGARAPAACTVIEPTRARSRSSSGGGCSESRRELRLLAEHGYYDGLTFTAS